MALRFFVDENDLALGRALAVANPEILYPGHSDLPDFPRGSLDDDWLPTVGRRGLVVITRDSRIRYRPVEKDRWVTFGVCGFVLTGKRSQSTQDSITLLQRWWTTLEDSDRAGGRAVDVCRDLRPSSGDPIVTASAAESALVQGVMALR